MAARGARAAAGDAGDRLPQQRIARARTRPVCAAFRQGLKEAGYVEGRNVAIEYRWAEGQNDRLPALAADLVRRQVAVIATRRQRLRRSRPRRRPRPSRSSSSSATIRSKLGLVASLNRPGGNVTGVTIVERGAGAEAAGAAARAGAHGDDHWRARQPDQSRRRDPIAETCRRRPARSGCKFQVLNASTEREIDARLRQVVELQAGGLVIATDALFISRREQLGALAARHAIPAIYQFREFAAAGGLMSYGGSLADMYRQSGIYTGRILKGEKPADLPVQQATKVELVINLKTAKALGLAVPPTLLGRADEVIE